MGRTRLEKIRNLKHCLSILGMNLKHTTFKRKLSQQNTKIKVDMKAVI
jgi:hypothetical protein